MEIVGGVASVAGVLSLAIQLVDSSFKLYKFLEAIQGATSEIVRLQEMVLQLHSIFKGAQDVLEQQNKQENVPPPDQYLYSALESCQSKVKILEDYITKTQRNAVQRGLRRVWGKVKIPFEQDQFAKINGQVQEACQIMNTALAINQTLLSVAHISRTELVISSISGQQTQKVETHAKDERNQPVVGTGIARRFVREDVVKYETILGVYRSRTVWTQPQIGVKNENHHSTASELLDYHTIVTFTPIVSQRFFTFTSRRAYGQVSRNIRVYITDPSRFAAICNKLEMHEEDHLLATTTFKQWLAEGGNPFLLDESGEDLLHKALDSGYDDIACLLIQMRVGLDPCLNNFGYISLLRHYGRNSRIREALSSGLQSSCSTSLELGRDSVTIYMNATSTIGYSISIDETQVSVFTTIGKHEWDILSWILGDCGMLRLHTPNWSFSDDIKLAAFVFDTVLGGSIDHIAYSYFVSWLLSGYWAKSDMLLACVAWYAQLVERGLTVEEPEKEISKFWDMQTTTRPLITWKKALTSGQIEDSLVPELQYDPQEACFELLREFEDIAIDFDPGFQSRKMNPWPYARRPYPRSIPRRHRKIMRRELIARQRERELRMALPGSFPPEHEDDDICRIHFREGMCTLCSFANVNSKYRVWKDGKSHED